MARVLLIDDCPDFGAWARCTLESEGLEVIEARDALAGLQRAVEDRPDCVVVAGALPGLDGLDVAARIAQEPTTAGLPVLIACDPAEATLRGAARAAGAQDLLPRTGRAADLTQPVRDALWAVGVAWGA
ncbi:MAG: response regulator [Myxococcota bacterium]